MKICAAQTRPFKGNVDRNIRQHLELIDLAVSKSADGIFFPELSLTGYEPELAEALATNQDDARFDVFQQISNEENLLIGAGMPILSPTGLHIGMIIFQPGIARNTYFKKYLHTDEEPFFVGGELFCGNIGDNPAIAPAICYEISIPEHAQAAYEEGAGIYCASVAKTVGGIEKAFARLSEIGRNHEMIVLMANCLGPCDGSVAVGRSSVWSSDGQLLGQLNDSDEGIISVDTTTGKISTAYLAAK